MPIHKAFEDWKAAHEAYIAAERRLADAETVYAFNHEREPRRLRDEVAQRRDEADRLLECAMQELRARAGAPQRRA